MAGTSSAGVGTLRRWGPARLALVGLDGFVALTAVAGGIALAVGMEASRFPLSWLEGTPFETYVLPGIVLAAVVGGTAFVAMAEVARGARAGGARLHGRRGDPPRLDRRRGRDPDE